MSNGYEQQQQRGNGQQLAECGRRRRGGSDGPVCRGADPRVPAAHTVNAVRKHHFRTLNLFIKMNTIFVCFLFCLVTSFAWIARTLGFCASRYLVCGAERSRPKHNQKKWPTGLSVPNRTFSQNINLKIA